MQKNRLAVQALVLGVLLAILLGVDSARSYLSPYPEAVAIGKNVADFKQLSARFTDLAKEKGAVYAYEVLRRAELPPNTDLHLLGHSVGDELYKQKGVAGISDCTQDFRNACSHTIVIGALQEFGEAAFPKIREACKLAPGGKGAYTMCFHGLGHGVLAYFQYELIPTINLCKKLGTEKYNNREYIECVGGAIMEIISGGGHDHDAWLKARAKYFKPDDALYPCDALFMPPIARPNCYTYLTPHLFEAVGADMGHPTPQNFEDAFRFCDAVPISDKENRASCFGGFGKEFTVLAQDRDVRKIEDMTSERLQKVADWCSLANKLSRPRLDNGDDVQGILDCDINAVQSLFWGGENKPDAALRFCAVLPEGKRRENCYSELTGAVSFYIDDKPYRANICDKYPEQYKESCRTRLLTEPQAVSRK